MSTRVEILLATMNQKNLDIVSKMNIESPVIIANQGDYYQYLEDKSNSIKMISTKTKGVGVNRNLALLLSNEEILLFSDDDMVYYTGYEQVILDEFSRNQNADVIIFNFDFVKNGVKERQRVKKAQQIFYHNSFKYGTCSIAIRKSTLEKHNLHFSTIFGGGCIYGSGEDSLFILDCLKAGLRVYTSKELIGKNVCKESTWFKGYGEKYLYDKGAWISCAFSKMNLLFKLYFVFRINYHMSGIDFRNRWRYISAGCKGFETLRTYEQWKNEV